MTLLHSSFSPESAAEEVATGSAFPGRLSVLIGAPTFDILGGQAVQAARLIERLRDEPSVEVELLAINPRLPGVLRKLQSIKYVRTFVTSLLYVANLLRRVPHFDVIHVFSASYFSFVLAPTPAILVGKLFGKKVLLNYHSGEASDHLARWPSAVRTIRLADEVIVPSDYLVRVFAEFGLSAKAIYNLVETEHFVFRERLQLRPVFLSNRNLESHYGVDRVLRAFALIQREVPEAALTVVGDGSERTRLERLASELGLRHTRFAGQINHEQIVDYYNAADIFLNGSEIDNQPLSILEAFACGLPIVSTDAGSIPDLVTHGINGLLVSRGDFQALAEAALRLLREPGLGHRLAIAGRDECVKFSWAAVREKWLESYGKLVDTPLGAGVTAERAVESEKVLSR